MRALPAYLTNGKKILPTKYRERLQSAIVEIQFTISHIVVNKKDIFGANVVNIDVLQPPQTLHIVNITGFETRPGKGKGQEILTLPNPYP